MVKTIFISSLAALLVIAIGLSAFNVLAGNQPEAQQLAPVVENAATNTGEAVAGQETVVQADAADQAAVQVEVAAPAENLSTGAAYPTGAQGAGGQGTGGQGGGYRGGQSGGQGGGNRRSQSGTGSGAQGTTGIPQPQNGMTGLVTYSGTVSAYGMPQFTLLTSDGQAILTQLGNQSYVASLGLVLQDGDAVTVTGFVDSSGALAVTSITNQSTGETYTLRDGTSGRPAWAGGGRQ